MPHSDLDRQRQKWRHFPRRRPARIKTPEPGQESVWDYPRPPRVEPVERRVRVEFAGVCLAESHRALRVLETSSPPCYYLPSTDVRAEHLQPSPTTSFCEWKGVAHYLSACVGERRAEDAAWTYPDPDSGFEVLRDHLAFFAGRVDACFLGDVRVRAQPGRYYGGWITPEIVGPFKGEPGSEDW
ncbi:MAG: DUF427 domain-containing protein [Myxococcota bacterium]